MTEDDKTVATRAQSIFAKNNSLTLATTGGPYSPWVAGVYFAHDGLALYTFLETTGKTFTNVRLHPRVSFQISENDAQKDFVQGVGSAVILDAAQEAAVRLKLEAKMPWYKTYTPVVPVRIDPVQLFVSSFASGWFPAKVLDLR